MKSPFSNRPAKFIKSIPVDEIAELYEECLFNIREQFGDIERIELFECRDTGYQFFHPFEACGNGQFYEKLEKIDWYYQEWKWDYDIALKFISKNDKILEIGCGKAHFIEKLTSIAKNVIGVDINKSAVESAQRNKLPVFNKSFIELDKLYHESLDIICSFQVLEHISNIQEFIQNCLMLLKKGGKLMFTVPNNEAFFFQNKKLLPHSNNLYINQLQTLCLNMPPHHMGLWTKASLTNLQFFFPITLINIIEENISSGRKNLNNQILINNYKNRQVRSFIKKQNKNIFYKGDSLFVIYEKK